MSALLSVVLLLIVAMMVDFGLVYTEKAQLQNAADAAALAVAGDCAKKIGTPGACPIDGIGTGQQSMANSLANNNSNDGSSRVALTNIGGVVTATTSTLSSGNHFLAMPLAALTGFDTAEIKAQAQASWGGIKSGSPVLPLTVGACELNPMGGADRMLVIHGSQKCAAWNESSGLNMPGGFGWLTTTAGCQSSISVDNPWVDSKTGASVPSGCDTLFKPSLSGQSVLVPIFGFADGTGASGTYKILGWGVFVVKGWNFPSVTYNWPFSNGNKGLYGHFTKEISYNEGFTWGGTTEYGAIKVKLTK